MNLEEYAAACDRLGTTDLTRHTDAEITSWIDELMVGGAGTLVGDKPAVKTVGSYWPYATMVFDFTRRAMPWTAPKSLTNDEVYAVTAHILRLNGIIGDNDVMDAKTLPQVKMPNRDGFVNLFPNKY